MRRWGGFSWAKLDIGCTCEGWCSQTPAKFCPTCLDEPRRREPCLSQCTGNGQGPCGQFHTTGWSGLAQISIHDQDDAGNAIEKPCTKWAYDCFYVYNGYMTCAPEGQVALEPVNSGHFKPGPSTSESPDQVRRPALYSAALTGFWFVIFILIWQLFLCRCCNCKDGAPVGEPLSLLGLILYFLLNIYDDVFVCVVYTALVRASAAIIASVYSCILHHVVILKVICLRGGGGLHVYWT